MSCNNNDPINPIPGGGAISIGLTKLEYFAAQAMVGFLANSYSDGVTQPLSTASRTQIAELAVKQAKAIMRILDAETGR
jgi:hypothetical protein